MQLGHFENGLLEAAQKACTTAGPFARAGCLKRVHALQAILSPIASNGYAMAFDRTPGWTHQHGRADVVSPACPPEPAISDLT
ncbi:hypothetical protein Pla100_60050 [Neorhodopirellula pilleata]|uniref:Uncharacterized protein n=1 Tax=Neorhodopirellula pilleata TaxID=2714738 RepID=A0A5C5ZIG6_9BACT|nr:hypothetical protein Pla100_60050 [Neorhodopirellula pilleata]